MSTSISTGLAAPTEGSSEPSDKAGVNGGSRSRSRSPGLNVVNPSELEPRSSSPARPPTSAEIDAVIAAAMANAPPAPRSQDGGPDGMYRSATPLMTNMLPASVGSDGRVNLFVGNLPYRVRWQDLKDLFRKAGTVLRADVSLGQDNRSRGYGTVLMGSREDAARAIDRFNGYTWQTRTLEVRPDRLPPEYEPAQAPPQMHHPHQPNRVPMFPYVGGNQFGQGHPGGHPGGGGGPGWHPQNHHRPPMQFGPPHHIPNHMGHPGMSHSPHPPPHMPMGGPGPGPGRSHSPAHFGPNGMYQPPLSGQNTGNHMYGPLGASPLAGSLSTGGDLLQRPGSALSNPRGLSPHSSSNLALPRAPSAATQPGPTSRPNSSTGHRSVSPGDASRGVPPVVQSSLGSTVPGPQMGSGHGHPHEGPVFPSRQSVDHGHVPHLEGLAHKKAILGPPGNLHDRVVFVSDLPLNMQWQELKDLLRPAGLIIRADVLVDSEGRSRGYGTALFGSEEDAARAVHLLNGHEVGGRRIRVYLERDSHHHDARRASQSQTSESGPGTERTQGQSSESSVPANTTSATTPDSTPSQSRQQMASRVPWHLNLNNQATPPRGSPNVVDSTPHFRSGFQTTSNGVATPHFRNMHHPGPISMPPWPPSLDSSNPLSPLQTRGLPPMTPSMPGFVFNNAYPDTPPVPHHFMSMGPFSPGLPVTSPTGFAYNPFLNAAPGAPIHRPQTGGSAQLGTPTTQVFPHNAIRGAGPPGAPMAHEEYFPSTDSQSQSQPQSQSPSQSQSQSQPQSQTVTPPSLGQRTASQSVLNARDRLAPSGPDSAQDSASINSLAASMALHNLTTDGNGAPETSTPPSPTSNRRQAKPVHSGIDLSKLVEESPESIAPRINGNGKGSTSSEDEASVRPARFSMDEKRPNLDLQVPIGGERRASFGDSR